MQFLITLKFITANYIHWRLVLQNIDDVNVEMAVLAIEFWDAIFGPYPLPPRYVIANTLFKEQHINYTTIYIVCVVYI